ncbi:MAG: TolC family protein [Bacteroidales bacterium]
MVRNMNIDFNKRRNYYKILLLVFVCLGISKVSFGQKKWSLQDCINFAYENNISVKKAQLDVETAEVDLFKSKMDILPSLSGSASHNYNWGRFIDPTTNQFNTQMTQTDNINFQSSLPIISGFTRINSIKQNKLDRDAAKFSVEAAKNMLALEITSNFLQVLYNQELSKASEAQVEKSKQQVEKTEKLVEAGTVAQGDLLNVKSQLAEEESKLISYKNQTYTYLVALQQALDLPIDPKFEIEIPALNIEISENVLKNPEDVYTKAVKIMPEILGAELNFKSSVKGVQIAKGALYPSLSFGANISTNYSDRSNPNVPLQSFGKQLEDNIAEAAGFALRIPIFNNYMARTQLNKAKIGKERSSYNLETAKLNLRKDIESAYTEALNAWRSYKSAEASLYYYQEAFKYTEQKYQVGLVSSYDYNIAKTNLTGAESGLIRAKYTYIFKTKVLDFYLGNPLTL